MQINPYSQTAQMPPPGGHVITFDREPDRRVYDAALELYRRFKDPMLFIPNSLKVQNRQGRLVDFQPKRAQVRLIELVERQRAANRPVRVIIDKTRRVGISAIIAGVIFQATPFEEGQSALIIAHEKKAARNLFNYYHRFEQGYKPHCGIRLPAIKSRTASQDSGALTWANRSSISIATAKTLDFSRSFDFRFLHLSEYAYYPSIRGLMTALIATVADDPGTMIFKESTANGYNDFETDWRAAIDGESDYEPFFVGCFDDEQNWRDLETDHIDPVKFEASLTDDEWALIERYELVLEQIYWRRKKLQDYNNDLKRFDQEYPHSWEVSFQSSGRQRFDPQLFVQMPTELPFERGELRKESIGRADRYVFRPHRYGELTIWKQFRKGAQYLGGVDVSRGVDINDGVGTPDPDWSVAEIGERNHGEQIMELHTRTEPVPFAGYLYDLGRWCYEVTGLWIYWVIEVEFSGGNGLSVITEMLRLGYPDEFIYRSEVLDEGATKVKRQVGFVIRPNNRNLLISHHERMLIEGHIVLHSKAAISEHHSFVKKANGKVEHMDQRHDDLVFGCMYLSWAYERAPVFKTAKPRELPASYAVQKTISEAQRQKTRNEARRRGEIRQSLKNREMED